MYDRNHHRTRPVTLSNLLVAALPVLLPACLDRNGGRVDTGFVALTTTDGTTGGTGTSTTSTTLPGIMTSTFGSGDPATSGTGDTDGTIDGCGNGVVEGDEACDQGDANADDGECTASCTWAVCGDGHVRADREACDDGPDNGTYDHCAFDCSGPGPRCGDHEVQSEQGEACDNDATLGCLRDCTHATTCVEILASWGDEVGDGIYTIHREGQELSVWCAMEADGGGYTILKHATTLDDNMNPVLLWAKDAEPRCDLYGMNLLVPRSPAHLEAVIEAANTVEFGHTNLGGIDGEAPAYLRIFGLYPAYPKQSCVGKALNWESCLHWQPGDKSTYYYITSEPLDLAEPSADNCAGCSLEFQWKKGDPPVLTGYTAEVFGGLGGFSTHFLCEIGDKLPM